MEHCVHDVPLTERCFECDLDNAGSNKPPFMTLDLDETTANFLMENTVVNIRFGLRAIQAGLSRETTEKLVEQLNGWRKLRDLLRLANPGIKDDY